MVLLILENNMHVGFWQGDTWRQRRGDTQSKEDRHVNINKLLNVI